VPALGIGAMILIAALAALGGWIDRGRSGRSVH
jgi:hypothetical protein